MTNFTDEIDSLENELDKNSIQIVKAVQGRDLRAAILSARSVFLFMTRFPFLPKVARGAIIAIWELASDGEPLETKKRKPAAKKEVAADEKTEPAE